MQRYEARLRGDPINEDLERAKILIPDEIWEAGPKVLNAEIRRLEALHAKRKLEQEVSPEPLIRDGKLTIGPNKTADQPDESIERLATLPERQREAIGALLDIIAAKNNACPVVVSPLGRYDAHIAKYGLRVMLDLLNDLHQIVRDEYLGLNREKFFDGERGLRRAFLTFFALHKELRAAFPLDAERENAIRSLQYDREALDPEDVKQGLAEVAELAHTPEEAGVAEPELAAYLVELTAAMRLAIDTPPPAPIDVSADPDERLLDPHPKEKHWATRILMKGGAFLSRLNVLIGTAGDFASIHGFFGTPAGAAFVGAIRKLLAALGW